MDSDLGTLDAPKDADSSGWIMIILGHSAKAVQAFVDGRDEMSIKQLRRLAHFAAAWADLLENE